MVARVMDQVVKPAALALGLSTLVPPAEARTDRPAMFVDVAQIVPGVILDVRYFGSDNFVGTHVDGYEAARCFLTRPAAEALAKVAEDARRQGYLLKLFDCYRPARAVAHFARWASDLADEGTKAAYYPDLAKSELFKEGYIASRSGHSRGSTLDLTLVQVATGAEVDMGTPFDLFSPRSWPESDAVTAAQKASRQRLADLMTRHGFVPFAKEWWHFTLKDEPFPTTSFDFPIR
jgi:D-alanyl-D-alanine dipeptidase